MCTVGPIYYAPLATASTGNPRPISSARTVPTLSATDLQRSLHSVSINYLVHIWTGKKRPHPPTKTRRRAGACRERRKNTATKVETAPSGGNAFTEAETTAPNNKGNHHTKNNNGTNSSEQPRQATYTKPTVSNKKTDNSNDNGDDTGSRNNNNNNNNNNTNTQQNNLITKTNINTESQPQTKRRLNTHKKKKREARTPRLP